MRKCAFLSVLLFLLIGGCGGRDKPRFTEEELADIPLAQKTGLPGASGGFVLAVGGETVTSDEVIAPLMERLRPIAQRSDFGRFKEQARPHLERILGTKVSDILLYSQAKKRAGEDIDEALEKLAEVEVRKFIVSFGSDYARAEQALKQDGMDWASFKEYQKRMILSQSYVVSLLPKQQPITYSELMDCYNRMRDELFTTPANLKFRLIDIQLEKLEIEDPNESRQQVAKTLADELVGRIHGGEDFGELAKQYSHGHRRMFGGAWKRLEPDSLAEPYDILAAEAERMQPGHVAGPIETAGHIFIMKLEEKRAESVEPFEKVQSQVEAKIDFDRRKKAVDELGAKIMQQARVGNRDAFIDFCLREIYWISNQ